MQITILGDFFKPHNFLRDLQFCFQISHFGVKKNHFSKIVKIKISEKNANFNQKTIVFGFFLNPLHLSLDTDFSYKMGYFGTNSCMQSFMIIKERQ